MRIVGGRFRGRPLAAPKGASTRPTSNRVRESVFNVLAHSPECPPLEGARIIDLFAGTGALGLEALSRGAAFALFVETDASARAAVQENIEAFGLQGVTRLFRRDATDLGPANARDRYDIAFLDPPYGNGLGERALRALQTGGWLKSGAIAILEERAGTALELPQAFQTFDERSYGDTTITFVKSVLPVDGGTDTAP
ncbi:MAG: 16S rRNA (guanine(966)-N(2))-methyltransferase RsmD [Alphaproteobacteria bacterium]|nr:16S rRNA (guanine(966)-N(2))-methyltransferase RsmD [Alphaproteobacteria bacterium]